MDRRIILKQENLNINKITKADKSNKAKFFQPRIKVKAPNILPDSKHLQFAH